VNAPATRFEAAGQEEKEVNVMNLDDAIADFVENRAIPIFGVANVQGFADALPGWNTKELMPKCESVVVLGHPLFQHALYMEKRTYIANQSWWHAQKIVDRQIAIWKGQLFALFDDIGLGVASFGKFRLTTLPTFSYRLAQVEAGVGVYGRAGVCINPDYGCHYRVGVLLTEVRLAPTNGTHLDGFKPCEGCDECGKVCPIRAIDVTKGPGAGYDRERCMRFIMKMSERSGTHAKICCQCFSVCPWSMGRSEKWQQNLPQKFPNSPGS
jgi:epoxyqueuosine reductase QueG